LEVVEVVVKRSISISEQVDYVVREVLADMVVKGEKNPSYSKALSKLVELGYKAYKKDGWLG